MDDMLLVRVTPRRFAIALTFPGVYREYASSIASKLSDKYGNDNILYDEYHRSEFSRRNLDLHLQKLYGQESDLIVVFLGSAYQERIWCGIEWRAIRDLLNRGFADNRIYYIKCDNGHVEGFYDTLDGYVDIQKTSLDDIVNDIIIKHNSVCPDTCNPKHHWKEESTGKPIPDDKVLMVGDTKVVLKDNLIMAEVTGPNGVKSYSEIDSKTGKVILSIAPYPISEYTVDIPKDLVLSCNGGVSFIDGKKYSVVMYSLKFDGNATIFYGDGILVDVMIKAPIGMKATRNDTAKVFTITNDTKSIIGDLNDK